jgi:uncharacterized membrane protein
VSDAFLWLKWAHVLSSTVLFGTGLGTAFQMWRAHRTRDARVIAAVATNVVLADWLFTLPSGLIQPLTGWGLIAMAGYDPAEPWLLCSYALYLLALACWLPVVALQIRARDLARIAAATATPLPPAYVRAMRAWFILGWPAFLALVAVFALMVAKPALW